MRTLSVVATLLLAYSVSLSAACNDLFISEYIEGSSYNKAIELYNPTDSSVDLSAYTLELYSNGSSAVSASFSLSGTLQRKDVIVISRANADAAIVAQSDLESPSVINFNGDDAIVLKKDGLVVDVFGQVGFDPGSKWSANGVATQDQTLVRKTDVLCGNTDPFALFDPSVQWDSFNKDTFTYLGAYGINETPVETAKTTYIHDIQGSSDVSPFVGQTLTIEGIVVGDYQEGGFKGFFVQEEDKDADLDPSTSEGIFVYCPSCSAEISLGDLVQLSGDVAEYNGLTQIKASAATVLGHNALLPTAISLQLPVSELSDFEKLEGMRVNLHAAQKDLVVNDNYNLGRYGSFTVASERMVQFTQNTPANEAEYAQHIKDVQLKSILVDDGSSYQNPLQIIHPAGGLSYGNTLRSGYTINQIEGILDQRYGAYQIQPLGDLTFNTETNPRVNAPKKDTHKHSALRVASFNVLNYFNDFDNCSYGVDGLPADCRGAEDALEFERQRSKIINAMLEVNADIFGLMEIENNGYGEQSALADLVNGLNLAAGKTIYRYVDVDAKTKRLNALGTDAIKVAIIYNTKRVHPVGKPYALKLDEDKSRPSLIQAFKKKSSANKIVVSVNHFKSKGSACADLTYEGTNDIDKHDGQGNCNLTRVHAAQVLTDFISSKKRLKHANLLLLGDFNSYAKEEPIRVIETAGFSNMLADKQGLDAYTYVFKAETGTLDYIFANKKLSKKIKSVTAWHNNTDEPMVLDYNFNYKSDAQHETLYGTSPYRASDHDPIIVDIKL